MKKIILYMTLCLIGMVQVACDQDIDGFDNSTNYIYFDLPFQLDQYGRKTTERVDSLVYSFAIVDLMSKEVTLHRNVMGKCVVAKGYDSVIFYIGEPSRINTLLISLKKLYLHVNQYSGKDKKIIC